MRDRLLIAYFDEIKFDPPRQPYYWLGAIVVPDGLVRDIEAEVAEVATECFGKAALSRETEFHAAEIYNRSRNFRSWGDIGRRLNVLKRLTKVIDRRGAIFKISIRIEPALMLKPDNIEGWAFMFLVERLNQLLRSKDQLGLLIGDYENEAVTNQAAQRLSRYRTENGTPYFFGEEITHLIDTVHFTRSHLSRMLQLADVYAWTLQFAQTGRHDQYPGSDLMAYLRASTEVLAPDKYKDWPTKDSWYPPHS